MLTYRPELRHNITVSKYLMCGQISTIGRTRCLRGGYGLIAALIAVVCVEALTTVDTKLSVTLVSIAGSL